MNDLIPFLAVPALALVLAAIQTWLIFRERRRAAAALDVFWSGRAFSEIAERLEQLPASITRDMAVAAGREITRSTAEGTPGCVGRVAKALSATRSRGIEKLMRPRAAMTPLAHASVAMGFGLGLVYSLNDGLTIAALAALWAGIAGAVAITALDAAAGAISQPALTDLAAFADELHALADRSHAAPESARGLRAVA